MDVPDAWSGAALQQRLQDAVQAAADSASSLASSLAAAAATPALAAAACAATAYAASLQDAGLGGYSQSTVALMAGGIIALALASSSRGPSYEAMQQTEQLPWDWDAAEVAAYWRRRPVAVATRTVQVLSAAAAVGAGLGSDYVLGRLQANARSRAAQVRGAIERLGPAYVKIAQAVSTRVDILSPAYLVEIERLQDRVPPFPTELALASMEAAWGRPASQVFARISPNPVAAASLGQVYRGLLAPSYGGAEVAVKVQRPDVRRGVGLDLYLMHGLAGLLRRLPQVKSDWVGLINEWAGRFFQELDYEREAASAAVFAAQMADLPGITVPDVLPELTSHTVLTTAWVEGEKLSESSAGDVRQLCTTLLNCYLIQLLETGLLHADPHPGNLIRTPEGRICILDFGLMTEVPPERAQALVEYIAHLSVEDFEAVVMHDLPALGFIPPGAPDPVASGLVAPLGSILRQLSQGGGAAGINIDDITVELDKLTRNYPFQVPAYFALILRAFSVIEGIALRVDPSYSIVKECFPYIARRLLTDNHPRTRRALHQLLYADKARLSISRLQRLTRGFSTFSVAGLQPTDGSSGSPGLGSQPLGSYLQEVLVNELVAAVSSLQRLALSNFARRVLGSAPAALASGAVAALGPWRRLLLPLPTPLELLSQLAPAVEPDAEDAEALALLREVAALLDAAPAPAMAGERGRQALATLQELAPMLPELAPGLGHTGELFVRTLVQRSAMRLASDVAPNRERARGRGASQHTLGRVGSTLRQPSEDDTIGDLKKLVAAQTGTRPEKIRIQKWYNVYKDHITLADYEIHDGMGLELYYN
ncbi:hypothetical protein WJX81_008125 [Elliptochloris bilobata]|uniref:Ubiquitin-like domain-containing protein n=1 Tax=Elliptochloris bilobata TaxID=381761 RepID=A0AAW1SCM2_9CHLO